MRLAFSTFSALSQSFSALAHWLHPSRGELSSSAAAPTASTASVCSQGPLPGAVSGIAGRSKPPLRQLASVGMSVPRSHITHRVHSATSGTTRAAPSSPLRGRAHGHRGPHGRRLRRAGAHGGVRYMASLIPVSVYPKLRAPQNVAF